MMLRQVTRWAAFSVVAVAVAVSASVVLAMMIGGVEPTKGQLRWCAFMIGGWVDYGTGHLTGAPKPNEYQIYNRILDAMAAVGRPASGSVLAIGRETQWDPRHRDKGEYLSEHFDAEALGSRLDEAVSSFIQKNRRRSLHRGNATFYRPHELVPLKSFEALLDAPGAWNNFNARYPDSGGLLVFSRVGFSQDGSVALVYVSQYCGSLCGFGGYVLYRREGEEWREIAFLHRWDS